MSILDSAIGLIAPPCCVMCEAEGTALCQACKAAEIIPYGPRCFNCGAISSNGRTCERCRPSSPRYVWVSTSYENAASELMKAYKFGHQRAAASSIAEIMADTLLNFLPNEYLAKLSYKAVPVPTATKRIRQRSFDHSALLARLVTRQLSIKSVNAMARIGQKRQVGAPRKLRMSQPDGSYVVRYPDLIIGRNILLVDDVVTTGATLRAVTRVLRAAGAARVDALVFAKRL